MNPATGGSSYVIDAGDITTTRNTQGYRFRQYITTGGSLPSFSIEPNRVGDYGYAALLVNSTEDVVGTATNKYLLDLQRNGTSRMVVQSGGNVGIGTASPGAKLDVIQALAGKAYGARIVYSGGVASSWYTDGSNISGIGADDNQAFALRTADINRLYVSNSGSVGIGTTAPDNTLTVNGTADKPGGGSWGTYSDIRLKDVKGPFSAGLSEVMKLAPIRYAYKQDNALGLKDKGEHVGFSAQDVQKILPDAVSANDKGYLILNQDPILWTMLNAIKEQQAEIEALKTKLAELSVGK